ncbi:ABC transporter permease [Aestuariibacter salexigens]|uniref:ABC transporter permease n=1 Tax=Aestuariibacter salexigens TaxID=226010 RepID=UPI0004218AD2
MSATNWEVGPILRALKRNKVGALLIALQIAVTMTIIVNAIFIIQERSQLMARESGLDDANSFFLSSTGFATDFDEQSTVTADLEAIRNTPGVRNAIQINAIPVSGGGWSMGLQTEPGEDIEGTGVAVYMVDEQGLDTLDVELIAGENFTANDILWRGNGESSWPDLVILSQAMVERLFPDLPVAESIGKTVYINNDEPMIIKGVIDKLQAPWPGWSNVENSMLVPQKMLFTSTRYFIRAEPGMRDTLMPQVEQMLADSNRGRIIRSLRSVEETRERTYRQHSGMIKILTTVMVILTIVTALGIVGLASFSVNRRKKQIGTRRALGASQGSIMRYFMLENFLISTMGVLLGAALTVGLNILLVNTFEMSRIEWYYVPAGMVVLWIVGQLAVYGPARKAAQVSPALATRTV